MSQSYGNEIIDVAFKLTGNYNYAVMRCMRICERVQCCVPL